jgi:ABC-type multidrug transport system fused ATPase/permease subunit
VGLLVVGLLGVFASLRELTMQTLGNTVRGVTGTFGRLTGAQDTIAQLNAVTDTLLRNWWWSIGGAVAVSVLLTGIIAWIALGAVLDRLERLPVTDQLDGPVPHPGTLPAPVPVTLVGAALRYPGARYDTLSGVDLAFDRPELVAVEGDNGSGKSTLLRLLPTRSWTRW